MLESRSKAFDVTTYDKCYVWAGAAEAGRSTCLAGAGGAPRGGGEGRLPEISGARRLNCHPGGGGRLGLAACSPGAGARGESQKGAAQRGPAQGMLGNGVSALGPRSPQGAPRRVGLTRRKGCREL